MMPDQEYIDASFAENLPRSKRKRDAVYALLSGQTAFVIEFYGSLDMNRKDFLLWEGVQMPYTWSARARDALRQLGRLAKDAGGWIMWTQNGQQPEFVPMAGWLQAYGEWKEREGR